MKDENYRLRSGTEPTVRSVFTRELCDFFDQMVLPAENWPGIKNNDLIDGIIDAVIHASKKLPDGMGIAMLQTLAYSALDAGNDSEGIINKKPLQLNEKPASNTFFWPLASNDFSNNQLSEPSSTNSMDSSGETGNFSSISPLFAMGYTVAEGVLNESARQEILKQAITIAKLPTLNSMEDRKKWGRGDSVARIQAVAEHIFWLATFQGEQKPGARERWIKDIAWIQEHYSNVGKKIDWARFDAMHLTKSKRAPNVAFMKALTPSKELAAIIGSNPLPRTEVTKKVWEYIKTHKLQDAVNRRMINADRKLLKIFNKKQASMFEMTRLVNDHLN